MAPKDSAVSLDFIVTGTVQIRSAVRSQPPDRSAPMRVLRSLADRQWTDEMPIGAFLISHPDGPILFDTGESPLCNAPGYIPAWSPTKIVTRTHIGPNDGIVAQLKNRGVEPKDLQAIVLSHLHSDHTGGLEDLATAAPDVPIYVGHEHWEAFGHHPLYASIQGCAPAHWPKDFSPAILKMTDGAVGPWNKSSIITPDGKLVAVDTPGHVPGHISLIVHGTSTDDTPTTYFLVGDATYGVDLLAKEEPGGINGDTTQALQSLKFINDYARQTELVVLPSHDAETPRFLKDRVVYKPNSCTADGL